MSLSFKPELLPLIPTGQKTKTRRPYDPSQTTWSGVAHRQISTTFPFVYELINGTFRIDNQNYIPADIESIYHNNRLKYKVGRDYAAIYGRGKGTAWYDVFSKAILPYDDVRGKTPLDLAARGYAPLRIRITELGFEDVRNISYEDAVAEGFEIREQFWRVWTGFYDKPIAKEALDSRLLWTRPEHLYQAIDIKFEIA